MYNLKKRRSYRLRSVSCPKCGQPVRVIRHDRYGVCLKCHEIFDVPELAAELYAERCKELSERGMDQKEIEGYIDLYEKEES